MCELCEKVRDALRRVSYCEDLVAELKYRLAASSGPQARPPIHESS
ncbi:MAG: hypothetical protein QXQ37_03560 [Nitrososphaerota archaeon]